MKKYLAILLTLTGAYGQDAYFNATVYGINNRNAYVVEGTIVAARPTLYEDNIEQFKMMQEHFANRTSKIEAEMAASRMRMEIERQTQLLQEIADK